jgi:hypothetical protein
MLKRILEFLHLRKRKRKPLYTDRERRNIDTTIDIIRKATHPQLTHGFIQTRRIPADGRVRGMWCIRSPWHNGAWIGGYYIPHKKLAVTVANPDDLNDYDDRVEQHEIAHWAEDTLGLVPPWHYAPWRRLFLHWVNVPAMAVNGGFVEVCDCDGQLPFTGKGDIVEVDLV